MLILLCKMFCWVSVTCKDKSLYRVPESATVNLFGKRAFADVILGWIPMQLYVSLWERQWEFGKRHREEKVMKMKAEVRVMQSPTKEWWQSPGAGGGRSWFSPIPSRGSVPYWHLDFGLLAPQTGREHVSYALLPFHEIYWSFHYSLVTWAITITA